MTKQRSKPSEPIDAEPPHSIREAERMFFSTLDKLEHAEPDLSWKILLWIVGTGLRTLRRCLQKPGSGVTWNSPFVTVNYPVELNWSSWKGCPMVAEFIGGTFTYNNTRSKRDRISTVSTAVVKHLVQFALRFYTNGAAWQKDKKGYTPVLPAGLANEWLTKRTKRSRDRFLANAFRGFSIGAGELEEFSDGSVLNEAQIQSATLIDIPPAWIPLEQAGHQLRVAFILRIHPLIVDVGRRQAYHPMTVGLAILPPETDDDATFLSLLNASWMNPGNWPAGDREEFWKILLSAVDSVGSLEEPVENLQIPAVRPQTISAQQPELSPRAFVFSSPKELEALHSQLTKMLLDFSRHGGRFQISWEPKNKLSPHNPKRLQELLNKAENACSSNSKGKALEDLICAIFESVPGLTCVQRVRTKTEEIDLVILNKSTDEWLCRMSSLILVECKNQTTKSDKNDLVLFNNKITNRRGQCTMGFLISWSGFTEPLAMEILRGSHAHYVIGLLDRGAIRDAVQTNRIYETLFTAWFKATTT